MVNRERGVSVTTLATEVDSLIRTQKVRISESIRTMNHVRRVPVTAPVRIPIPRCRSIKVFENIIDLDGLNGAFILLALGRNHSIRFVHFRFPDSAQVGFGADLW